MITRERITSEINQIQEPYLSFLYRIIRSLIPVVSTASTVVQEGQEDESWENFLQNTYGAFQNEPLERFPQGVLEIREVLE